MRDRRVEHWPLMSGLSPTVVLCAIYVYIVKVWGPEYMRDRKPYGLKNLMAFYNLIQVVVSAYMCYVAFENGWRHYNWFKCTPVDTSMSPQAMNMASITWWYFISKFLEFSDTFFFIARKKFGQVSYLHVYHHVSMPIMSWIIARFVPGGHETFGGLWNTFVHTLMYSYYFLSGLGPAIQPFLWWKRHLTKVQMVQFCAVLSHSLHLVLWKPDCDYPWQISGMAVFQTITLFAFFFNFYVRNYEVKAKNRKTEAKGIQVESNGVLYINGKDKLK